MKLCECGKILNHTGRCKGCATWNKDQKGCFSESTIEHWKDIRKGKFTGVRFKGINGGTFKKGCKAWNKNKPYPIASLTHKGKVISKETRLLLRKANLGKRYSTETKEKHKKRMKEFWANPANAKLRFEQIGCKPNKLEIGFQTFLDKQFPGEWKYVGDGQIWIAGKCPDFWNMNGRKAVIELFGTYWHKPEDEEIRKAHFGKYGYETIIVWDHELSNKTLLLEKLQEEN